MQWSIAAAFDSATFCLTYFRSRRDLGAPPVISRARRETARGGLIYATMSAERCYSLVYSGFCCQIEDDLSQKLHSGVLMTVHVLCGVWQQSPQIPYARNIQMRLEANGWTPSSWRRSNVNSGIDSNPRSLLNLGLGRLLLNTALERIAPKMRRISLKSLSILMYGMAMVKCLRFPFHWEAFDIHLYEPQRIKEIFAGE